LSHNKLINYQKFFNFVQITCKIAHLSITEYNYQTCNNLYENNHKLKKLIKDLKNFENDNEKLLQDALKMVQQNNIISNITKEEVADSLNRIKNNIKNVLYKNYEISLNKQDVLVYKDTENQQEVVVSKDQNKINEMGKEINEINKDNDENQNKIQEKEGSYHNQPDQKKSVNFGRFFVTKPLKGDIPIQQLIKTKMLVEIDGKEIYMNYIDYHLCSFVIKAYQAVAEYALKMDGLKAEERVKNFFFKNELKVAFIQRFATEYLKNRVQNLSQIFDNLSKKYRKEGLQEIQNAEKYIVRAFLDQEKEKVIKLLFKH
jgi:hypothetical protein